MCETDATDKMAALVDALAFTHKRLRYALEALTSMVNQHCTDESYTQPGWPLDSFALSANAQAMELLADEGVIEIQPPIVGRRVIACWATENGKDTADV